MRKIWLRFLPWRYMIKRLALGHGFIDPLNVLEQARQFAQTAEVSESTELLRAGVVFHARGLINTQAIQHNLDWVWPYWVRKQFDPLDESFIPRAFSITHVNLTHRNWTALGVPDCDWLPIQDERGLLTPYWDGWSIDVWLMPNSNEELLPSRTENCRQEIKVDSGLQIETVSTDRNSSLSQIVTMELNGNEQVCSQRIEAMSAEDGILAVSVRPYNPEGVSFINSIHFDDTQSVWSINDSEKIQLGKPPERHIVSDYRGGDVYGILSGSSSQSGLSEDTDITCNVGLASAAAVYPIKANEKFDLEIFCPSTPDTRNSGSAAFGSARAAWESALSGAAELSVPDARMSHLYRVALRTLVLLSPHEMYPGPYTYKRFWCRDAAFMVHALLLAGLADRVPRVFPAFMSRQTSSGHYCSQDGEWDANGQALWMVAQYVLTTRSEIDSDLRKSLVRAADWIRKKRTSSDVISPHAGLLPAGFSAEHLGPNDYYYWDDFWSIGGLRSAADAFDLLGYESDASRFREEADSLKKATDKSLEHACSSNRYGAIPASPYRRMDAGAIGSLSIDYPLHISTPGDERVLATANYLRTQCSIENAFFQDMIHSGLNAYLTLHVAQVLLRAGDSSFFDLVQRVSDLASETGQWPEAIHPRTGGGCMGDGQHGWAAAEWVVMIRSMFVREEGTELHLGSGVPQQWLSVGETVKYGPTPTRFGPVSVEITVGDTQHTVAWESNWHEPPTAIWITLPSSEPISVPSEQSIVHVPAGESQ